MKLNPTTKNNPCPICDNTSGKCRQGSDDPEFRLCMANTEARVGELINGYKCIGHSSDQTWGEFKPADSPISDRDRNRERIEANRQKQAREKAEALQKALPVAERDKAIRNLAKHFGLADDHRADLLRRGLTASQIEAAPIFTIEPGRLVPQGIPYNLAGIWKGKISGDGRSYACPAFDPSGQVTAWQIRLDNTSDNKYRWAKGSSSSKLAIDGKLELPITSIYPSEILRKEIYICEGILKPYVAAHRLGAVFLGASSARFAVSPKQTEQHLAAAAQVLGRIGQIVLCPDGGAVTNPGVLRAYAQTIKFIKSLGYEVQIAWWGQTVKGDPDIDEMTSEQFAEVDFYTIKQFQEKILWRSLNSLLSTTKDKTLIASIQDCWNKWSQISLDTQSKFGGEKNSIHSFTSHSHIALTALDTSAIRLESEEAAPEAGEVPKVERMRLEGSTSGQRTHEQRACEQSIYESLTTIQEKPWKEINQELIDLEALGLEPRAIYVVKSAKGTGKTKALIPIVAGFENCLAWFNRIALGREECHRIGLTWKDDQSAGKGNKRGFCSDSAPQFSPYILGAGGLLLVDEADQVFEHNFGDTCNKNGKRPLILSAFQAQLDSAIYGGGNALFMSADIAQKEIDYLRALAPKGCPIRVIVNHYQPPKKPLSFDLSKNPEAQIKLLLEKQRAGIPSFVIDDLRTGINGCKSIAEFIRRLHPEWAAGIVEINSDTSGSPEIINFLKNINEASMETSLICCSPSVVSGISLENGRFADGVFGFFNGVLTVNEACQALSRVRGARSTNVWAAEEGLAYTANRATDPAEIKAWFKRNYEANCKHILGFGVEYDPIKGEWDSPHFDLYCKNAAYRNLCMANLRERLHERLQEDYKIELLESESDSEVKQGLKSGWSVLEVSHVEAVARAKILSEEEVKALSNGSKQPTPEQKLDLEKTFLLKSFGQELIDATTFEHKESGRILTGFAAMALKNKRGVYRSQLEAFHLLQSELGEAIAKDLAEERKQEQHGEGRFCGDLHWRTRKRKAREFLGLGQFLDPERKWEPNDFDELKRKAQEQADHIKDVLNLSVGSISGAQIFSELMGQLGLSLQKEWAPPQPGRKRFKLRQINPESWRYAQMYCRYKESLKPAESAENVTVQAEESLITPPSISIESQGGGDQNSTAETLSKSGVLGNCATFELSQGGFGESVPQTEYAHVTVETDSIPHALITPPSISIESQGGGDQNSTAETLSKSGVLGNCATFELSQGGMGSNTEQLAQALPYCDSRKAFEALIEGEPIEDVRAAIANQSEALRHQMIEWLDSSVDVPETAADSLARCLSTLGHFSEFKRMVRGIAYGVVEAAIYHFNRADLRQHLQSWLDAVRLDLDLNDSLEPA